MNPHNNILVSVVLLLLAMANCKAANKKLAFMFPVRFEKIWYNLAPFFSEKTPLKHPGGRDILRPYLGKDITSFLNGFHRNHRRLLDKCPRIENGLALSYLKHKNIKIDETLEEKKSLPKEFSSFDGDGQVHKFPLIKSSEIDIQKAKQLHKEFREWILDPTKMPCVAAKSVICAGTYGLYISDKPLGAYEAAVHHLKALIYLKSFQDQSYDQGDYFTSLIALFPNTQAQSVVEFENLTFQHQQHLLDLDPYNLDDSRVKSGKTLTMADNPFNFSQLGRQYFVVGLSPVADRTSRRAPSFTLVFNAHEQFDWLQKTKQFDPIVTAVRRRDIKISGNINPNLITNNPHKTDGWEVSGIDHGQDQNFRVPLEAKPLELRKKEGLVLYEK